jgi:hypothetical protein
MNVTFNNKSSKFQLLNALKDIVNLSTKTAVFDRLRKKITIIIAPHTNQNTRCVRMCTTRTAYTSRFIVDEFTYKRRGKFIPETEHTNFDIYKFIPNLSLPNLAVLFGPFGLLAPKQ